jgi:hypothetical protein
MVVDAVAFQSLLVGGTLLFRFLDSDDYDSMWSELHPYDGEVREYWGYGDVKDKLKMVRFHQEGRKWF